MAEKKVKEESVQPEDGTVGAMLRAARMEKKLSLEEVSKALRIRAAQLKVIEENNVEALPGMTYAVGFVRSYANYLGLNGVEVVQKFKAEHGQDNEAKLSFPEPVAESRMPDPIMIGIGAFLAIVVLVIWSIASNHSVAPKTAEVQTPPVATAEETPPVSADTAAALVGTSTAITASATPAPEAPKEDAKHAEEKSVAAAPVVEKKEDAPVAAAEPPKEEAKPVEAEKIVAAETPPKEEVKKEEKKADVINVKRGKTRITLTATQDSWIQVNDTRKGVIFKKVLRPGESYSVPDQSGLSLVTANAGGIDIYVDGQKAPSVGRAGEIVRGIVLDPDQLKKKRIRMND